VLNGISPRGIDEEQGRDIRAQRARPFIQAEFPKTCGIASENGTGPSTVGGNTRERESTGVSPLFALLERNRDLKARFIEWERSFASYRILSRQSTLKPDEG
jgi:hypothetical protein